MPSIEKLIGFNSCPECNSSFIRTGENGNEDFRFYQCPLYHPLRNEGHLRFHTNGELFSIERSFIVNDARFSVIRRNIYGSIDYILFIREDSAYAKFTSPLILNENNSMIYSQFNLIKSKLENYLLLI